MEIEIENIRNPVVIKYEDLSKYVQIKVAGEGVFG